MHDEGSAYIAAIRDIDIDAMSDDGWRYVVPGEEGRDKRVSVPRQHCLLQIVHVCCTVLTEKIDQNDAKAVDQSGK